MSITDNDQTTQWKPDPYPEPEVLRNYAARIGAERRNFRTYIIRELERELYHFDRYVIRIDAQGDVGIRDHRRGEIPDELLPTEDEAAKIKEVVAAADQPAAAS